MSLLVAPSNIIHNTYRFLIWDYIKNEVYFHLFTTTEDCALIYLPGAMIRRARNEGVIKKLPKCLDVRWQHFKHLVLSCYNAYMWNKKCFTFLTYCWKQSNRVKYFFILFTVSRVGRVRYGSLVANKAHSIKNITC